MALATCSFDCGRGFANRLAARIEFGDDVMGIFDALNTSVAGLQAQSFALQNISGNIANAQTTGYKGIGTNFVDLVPDSTSPDRQVAGSVTAFARETISSQGTVSAATVAPYMAVNGDGFFSVARVSGAQDLVHLEDLRDRQAGSNHRAHLRARRISGAADL